MEKVTFEAMEVGYLSDIPRLGARLVRNNAIVTDPISTVRAPNRGMSDK